MNVWLFPLMNISLNKYVFTDMVNALQSINRLNSFVPVSHKKTQAKAFVFHIATVRAQSVNHCMLFSVQFHFIAQRTHLRQHWAV